MKMVMHHTLLLFCLFSAQLSYGISFINPKPCCPPEHLTQDRGRFTDGSDENKPYLSNVRKEFWLQPKGFLHVVLQIERLETEKNMDFVYVFNGPNEESPLIGAYSGTILPHRIVSSNKNGSLFVVFDPDSTHTFSGFSASFYGTNRTTGSYCPTTTTSCKESLNPFVFCNGTNFVSIPSHWTPLNDDPKAEIEQDIAQNHTIHQVGDNFGFILTQYGDAVYPLSHFCEWIIRDQDFNPHTMKTYSGNAPRLVSINIVSMDLKVGDMVTIYRGMSRNSQLRFEERLSVNDSVPLDDLEKHAVNWFPIASLKNSLPTLLNNADLDSTKEHVNITSFPGQIIVPGMLRIVFRSDTQMSGLGIKVRYSLPSDHEKENFENCSNHGIAKLDADNRSYCLCNEGWFGSHCSEVHCLGTSIAPLNTNVFPYTHKKMHEFGLSDVLDYAMCSWVFLAHNKSQTSLVVHFETLDLEIQVDYLQLQTDPSLSLLEYPVSYLASSTPGVKQNLDSWFSPSPFFRDSTSSGNLYSANYFTGKGIPHSRIISFSRFAVFIFETEKSTKRGGFFARVFDHDDWIHKKIVEGSIDSESTSVCTNGGRYNVAGKCNCLPLFQERNCSVRVENHVWKSLFYEGFNTLVPIKSHFEQSAQVSGVYAFSPKQIRVDYPDALKHPGVVTLNNDLVFYFGGMWDRRYIVSSNEEQSKDILWRPELWSHSISRHIWQRHSSAQYIHESKGKYVTRTNGKGPSGRWMMGIAQLADRYIVIHGGSAMVYTPEGSDATDIIYDDLWIYDSVKDSWHIIEQSQKIQSIQGVSPSILDSLHLEHIPLYGHHMFVWRGFLFLTMGITNTGHSRSTYIWVDNASIHYIQALLTEETKNQKIDSPQQDEENLSRSELEERLAQSFLTFSGGFVNLNNILNLKIVPGSREGAIGGAVGDFFVLYGGLPPSDAVLADFWFLYLPVCKWVGRNPQGMLPGERYYGVSTVRSNHSELVFGFGLNRHGFVRPDLWVLNIIENKLRVLFEAGIDESELLFDTNSRLQNSRKSESQFNNSNLVDEGQQIDPSLYQYSIKQEPLGRCCTSLGAVEQGLLLAHGGGEISDTYRDLWLFVATYVDPFHTSITTASGIIAVTDHARTTPKILSLIESNNIFDRLLDPQNHWVYGTIVSARSRKMFWATANFQVELTLHLHDHNGIKIKDGGAKVDIVAQLASTSIAFPAFVTDNGDGSYYVNFKHTRVSGVYRIHISINGVNIYDNNKQNYILLFVLATPPHPAMTSISSVYTADGSQTEQQQQLYELERIRYEDYAMFGIEEEDTLNSNSSSSIKDLEVNVSSLPAFRGIQIWVMLNDRFGNSRPMFDDSHYIIAHVVRRYVQDDTMYHNRRITKADYESSSNVTVPASIRRSQNGSINRYALTVEPSQCVPGIYTIEILVRASENGELDYQNLSAIQKAVPIAATTTPIVIQLYDPTTKFEISDLGVRVSIALTTIGITICICLVIFNYRWRKRPIILMSAPRFNSIIIVGCIIGYLCLLLLPTADYCLLRLWSLSLGFVTSYGALFAKTYRVHKLVNNPTMSRKIIPDMQLFHQLCVFLIMEVVLLLMWSIIDPPQTTIKVFAMIQDRDDSTKYILPSISVCSSKNTSIFLLVSYGSKIVFLISGVWLSWKTRSVYIPALNDSKYIAFGIYTTFIIAMIVIPIFYLIDDGFQFVEAAFYISSFSVFIVATTILALVFGPKIYAILNNLEEEWIDSDQPELCDSKNWVVSCTTKLSSRRHSYMSQKEDSPRKKRFSAFVPKRKKRIIPESTNVNDSNSSLSSPLGANLPSSTLGISSIPEKQPINSTNDLVSG